ncbi:MAG: hypothetical protein QXI19_10240, partial [Candidatus Caldarchaeum sp.]
VAGLTVIVSPRSATLWFPPLLLICRFALYPPAAPGAKRTTISCGCPGLRLKLPPETTLNGAAVVTLPVSLPAPGVPDRHAGLRTLPHKGRHLHAAAGEITDHSLLPLHYFLNPGGQG